jgi:hypothetical protein
MGGACSANVEPRNGYKILSGKPEVTKPLEKPRRRWEDNIKKDVMERVLEGVD